MRLFFDSRITKPPGGETSEIFGTPTSTPPTTPRKVKNYMASTIFSPDETKSERPIRARTEDNSFNRLFGNEDGKGSPRGKNWQKSNIVFADGEHGNGHSHKLNGHSNGYTNGSESGYSTPDGSSTCGSSNGSINGDAEPPKISELKWI